MSGLQHTSLFLTENEQVIFDGAQKVLSEKNAEIERLRKRVDELEAELVSMQKQLS